MNTVLLPSASYCQNINFLGRRRMVKEREFKKYLIFQEIWNGKKMKASIISPKGKEYKSAYFRKMIKEMLYCCTVYVHLSL